MVALLGSRDELLRVIEAQLDSDVHVRGNEITITGAAADNAIAVRLFEELLELVKAGQNLTADAVTRALRHPHRRHRRAPGRGAQPEHPVPARQEHPAQDAEPEALRRRHRQAHRSSSASGPAGTGKTYLAVAKAVQALLAKEVSRIILTRPAVEAGERLGFLPGTLFDKIDPYLRPLFDALHDMLDPDSLPRLMQAGTIEIAPLAYMRGRTLNDAFIILDEAQNTTPEQMKMFLTRLGLRLQDRRHRRRHAGRPARRHAQRPAGRARHPRRHRGRPLRQPHLDRRRPAPAGRRDRRRLRALRRPRRRRGPGRPRSTDARRETRR